MFSLPGLEPLLAQRLEVALGFPWAWAPDQAAGTCAVGPDGQLALVSPFLCSPCRFISVSLKDGVCIKYVALLLLAASLLLVPVPESSAEVKMFRLSVGNAGWHLSSIVMLCQQLIGWTHQRAGAVGPGGRRQPPGSCRAAV